MPDEKQFNRVMRASAWYDLVVTAPFATPWSFSLIVAGLAGLHGALGLPGTLPQPDFLTTLFANLMGSVVVVWSLARIHLGLNLLGRYDAVARILFAAWQIYALLHGASWLLLPLLVVEVGFAIAQSLPIRRSVRPR
jgi:hypothetical protein